VMSHALAVGDIDGAMKSGLLGLSLLMPLGSLAEILVSLCAAFVMSQLLVRSKLFVPSFTQRLNATMRMTARR
jgi:hypothetical protein